MNPHPPLLSADELAVRIDHCRLVDTRHDLSDPAAGRRQYEAGHLPGAIFLHMDEQLSLPRGPGLGRHPMPTREDIRALLDGIGLRDDEPLVTYDGGNGMAGRLWWMARWIGHAQVFVLDGGIAAWTRAGFPLSTEMPPPVAPGGLTLRAPLAVAVDASETAQAAGDSTRRLIDARPGERFRGEVEPIDPVAGHIPGAVNRPWSSNLREDGRFKPAPVLRQELEALLGGRAPQAVVHSCGSGVSACMNLLAMEAAGLPGAALYPGSWSEWITNPARPVATGPAD